MFQLVMTTVFLGSVLAALRRTRAVPSPLPRQLRFVVPDLFMLDHLGRVAGVVLRSGPSPDAVVIDLDPIAYLDDSGLASLEYACVRWVSAGVAVTLSGCQPSVAEAILRRGLPVLVQAKRRVEVAGSPTLH